MIPLAWQMKLSPFPEAIESYSQFGFGFNVLFRDPPFAIRSLPLSFTFYYAIAQAVSSSKSGQYCRMVIVSSSQRGRGMNKHYWTCTEDTALVNSLVELFHDNKWRADNGFRNGYLAQLERIMEDKIPGCGIKASPHIESRVKTLKAKWCALSELLSQSGFDWSDEKMELVCERSAYDEWVKTHKDAGGLYGKPFPHFYSLGEVYGRDRATGANVASAADDEEDIRQEDIAGSCGNTDQFDVDLNDPFVPHGLEDSEDSLFESPATNQQQRSTRIGRAENNTTNGARRGKRKHMDEISDSFAKVAESVASIAPMINGLINVLSNDKDMAELMNKLNMELSKIEDLTCLQKFRASELLGSKPDQLRFFYTLSEEEKRIYIFNIVGNRFN